MNAALRFTILGLVGVLVGALGGQTFGQGTISDLPPEYETWLAPHLAPTPEAAVSADARRGSDPAPDGAVLLDEEIYLVRNDGSHVVAVHRVLEPSTPRGAERLARIPYPFLASSERISLAKARRLTPDGEVIDLRAGLAFVQTPEVLRECEHYSEVAELVMLFPRVRPGDLVEYVVVREAAATIPDEFTTFLPVADPWPVRRVRRELLMPEKMAARLQSVPVGLEARAHREEPRGGDHVSLAWSFSGCPAVSLEPGRAPVRQVGPGIWVTTLESWDDVAAWYASLTEEAAAAGGALHEIAAERTEGLDERREIVRALHRTVAREIDYVGIEFGMGRLAPRPPAEVWRSGFGDCKDQALLLRTLLAEAGITAHLVLVNTTHAGRIERRAPDFRQFDHVIVAVPTGDGGHLFCDPAEPAMRAGELTSSCRGREALIVRQRTAEFVQMPPAEPEQLIVQFDLELDAFGELEGWMRIEADGHQGRMLIGELSRGERDASLQRTGRFVERFFPKAEVVDTQREEEPEQILFAAYFTGRVETEWRGAKLYVPHGGFVLPEVGSCEDRETPFYQPLGRSVIEVTYALPSGWAPRGELPDPWERATPAARTRAAWECAAGRCVGRLEVASSQRLVDPAAFPTFRRTISGLADWLDVPLHIGEAESARSASPEPAQDEDRVRMPRLSSGQGQLRLVDVQYPRSGDLSERRAALECVRRWFPDDPQTAMQAGLEISVIDQVSGRVEQSLTDIRRLRERYGDRVPRKLTAWAAYLEADALRELGEDSKARRIYERLAHDEELSPHRRGWSYLEAARARRQDAPLEAVDLLDEAMGIDSPALSDQISLSIHILTQGAPAAVARDRLERVSRLHPHRAVEAHRRIVDDAAEHLRRGRLERARALSRVVVPLIEEDRSLAELTAKASCLERSIRQTEACVALAKKIDAHLNEHPPEWWDDVALDTSQLGRDRLVLVLQQLDRSQQVRRFVRGTVALITRWQVAPDFFAFLIWRCADQLEESGLSPPLAEKFRVWSEELPPEIRHEPQRSTREDDAHGRRVTS